MVQPTRYVDPSVWQYCCDTAASAKFWRGDDIHDCNDVNVVLLPSHQDINETDIPSAFRGMFRCSAKVVNPSLAEWDSSPSHTTHIITERDVTVCVDSSLVSMINTLRKGISEKALTCICKASIKIIDGFPYVMVYGSDVGLSLWKRSIDSSCIRFAELFAGGFGGWSVAIHYLSKFAKMPVNVALALDKDFDVAQMYSQNHGSVIFPRGVDFRAKILCCPGESFPFLITQVEDLTWIHLIAQRDVDFFVLSPPCPAFSKATKQHGFSRADGKVTIDTAKIIRFTQPPAFLLENTDGMGENRFLSILVAVMKWAGYELIHHATTQLSHVTATMRDRWIGIFVRKDLAPEWLPVVPSWFSTNNIFLRDLGIHRLELPESVIDKMLLGGTLEALYGDVDFLPWNLKLRLKKDSNSSRYDVCSARVPKWDQKFNTFVARYGSQHDLPLDTLKNGGLFAQLLVHEKGFRFISPFEQILCFGVNKDFWLPQDLTIAHHCVGNAISPQQAIYFVAKMLASANIREACRKDAIQHVDEYMSVRIQSDDVHIVPVQDWYVLTTKQSTTNHQPRDIFLNLVDTSKPKRKNDDCIRDDPRTEISPTVPFRVHESPAEVGAGQHETGSEREIFGDEVGRKPKVAAYHDVVCILPNDILTVRYASGTSIRNILWQEGYIYIPEMMQVRNLHDQTDVMDVEIRSNMTIIVSNTDREQVVKGGKILSQIVGDRIGHVDPMSATNCVVIFEGKPIWAGVIPKELPLKYLHTLTQHAFKKCGIHGDLRWSKGGMVLNPHWQWRISDISQSGFVKLHVHLPISAGGFRNPKGDEQLKAALISELATVGVNFNMLMSTVSTLTNLQKATEIRAVLNEADNSVRKTRLSQMMKESGIDVETHQLIKHSAASKIQKAIRDKKIKENQDIDIHTIQINEGTFVNSDGSRAQIHVGNFSPNGSGLYLTQLGNIASWISASNTISSDELAVLVVGHHSPHTSLVTNHLQVPAEQNGNPIVLKATLFQLGEKHVTENKWKKSNINCPNTSVVAFTVFRDEYTPDEWSCICKSPTKMILIRFTEESKKSQILGVWGHSYQKDRRACPPEQSDSIQIHARIITSAMSELLTESGWNAVYMIPKTTEGSQVDTQYAILWCGTCRQQTEVMAKALATNVGLVRNKGRFGVRIPTGSYEASWKTLWPHKPAPDHLIINTFFRAQNIPVSATNAEVGEWLKDLQWVAKPIKKVSRGDWIIGSGSEPPTSTCFFNGSLVIITKDQPKTKERNSVVVSGKVKFGQSNVDNDNGSKQHDPWQTQGSPWDNYRPTTTGPVQQPLKLVSTPVTRTVDAPTAAKLADQEKRIEDLGRQIQDIQKDVTSKHSKLVDVVNKNQSTNEKNLRDLNSGLTKRIDQQEISSKSQFAAVQMAIQSSQQAQEEQFKALRDLLTKNTSEPRKAPRTDRKQTPGASPDQSGDEKSKPGNWLASVYRSGQVGISTIGNVSSTWLLLLILLALCFACSWWILCLLGFCTSCGIPLLKHINIDMTHNSFSDRYHLLLRRCDSWHNQQFFNRTDARNLFGCKFLRILSCNLINVLRTIWKNGCDTMNEISSRHRYSTCLISKCLSNFGWKHLTPASPRFLVQNAGFGAFFGDFLGSNFWISFVTEAGLKLGNSTHDHAAPKSGSNCIRGWSRALIFFVLAVPTQCVHQPVSGIWAQRQDGFLMMFGMNFITSTHGSQLISCRIGEASHPGPLNVTVCNVTGLNEKSIDICKWSGHLCGIAETAATETVIRRETNRVRPLKKHLFHGKHVLPNQITKNGADSLKGQSKGVAFLTNLPFRVASQWSKITGWQACRIVAGFVRISNVDVLAVTVYGYQRNYPEANALNGQLHSQVFFHTWDLAGSLHCFWWLQLWHWWIPHLPIWIPKTRALWRSNSWKAK